MEGIHFIKVKPDKRRSAIFLLTTAHFKVLFSVYLVLMIQFGWEIFIQSQLLTTQINTTIFELFTSRQIESCFQK